MNSLELRMREPRLHQQRHRLRRVQELLEIIQARHQRVRRRRHKPGIARTTASDPVLRMSEITRSLVSSACIAHENSVDLAYQAQAEREPTLESIESILHRCRAVSYTHLTLPTIY